MPRTGAAGELIKSVTSLTMYRLHTTPVTTVTTAAVTGDGTETTVAISSATGFASANSAFIIGDGGVELVTLGTTATTMPVTPPPKIPQSSGARFEKALAVSLGKYVQGSISWTSNRSLTSVFEEVADTPVVYIPGLMEFGLSFNLFNHNGLNLQRVAGYEESETGDGAAEATAYQTILGVSGQTVHTELVFVLKMLRFDAKKFELQFCNSFIETAINANPSRTNPASLNAAIKCSILKVKQWT